MKLEAEDAAVPSGCSVAMMPRLGYSGNGYLSGLDAKNDSSLVLNAEIPATQHYDITVVVGASAASTCKIQVDGETVYTMKTDATNNFMRVKIQESSSMQERVNCRWLRWTALWTLTALNW